MTGFWVQGIEGIAGFRAAIDEEWESVWREERAVSCGGAVSACLERMFFGSGSKEHVWRSPLSSILGELYSSFKAQCTISLRSDIATIPLQTLPHSLF